MRLLLIREYGKVSTTGELYAIRKDGVEFICNTMELPYNDNKPQVSCIPEGTYSIVKNMSPKFGKTWLIQNVPGRSEILMHKGNYINYGPTKKSDSKGCILPVSSIDATGTFGSDSGKAFDKADKELEKDLENQITIIDNKNYTVYGKDSY